MNKQIQNTEEKNKLTTQIRKAWQKYKKENGEAPLFALCKVKYREDDSETQDSLSIKLKENVIKSEDDDIFYYCSGLDDFISLCENGTLDFIIARFEEFFQSTKIIK